MLFTVSNEGPLGSWDLVFTPEAMILSQFVLAAPVITGVSLAAVSSVEQNVRDAAYAMGGTRFDVALVTIKEARYGIATAVLAGFGRAISEVGSVLIVGGNIANADGTSVTRTLTTAIQLEARQGRFRTAMILGAILVALVLLVNALVVRLGNGGWTLRMTLDTIDVHHGYGTETVFDGVSLCSSREVLAIIGPSGVGKSTLLRLLALFDAPDQGTVRYGANPSGRSPSGSDSSTAGESGWCFRRRVSSTRAFGATPSTGFESVSRGQTGFATNSRRSSDGRTEPVMRSTPSTPSGYGRKPIRTRRHSGRGPAGRVRPGAGLRTGRAVARRADVGPRSAKYSGHRRCRPRGENRGIGVGIATHDMHQAERIADRVAVLLENDVIEIGSPETVFENPADERTRKFIDGELVY